MKNFLLIGMIVGMVLILVGGGGVVYTRVTAANNPSSVTVVTNQNRQQNIVPFGPDDNVGGNLFRYGLGGVMRQRGFQVVHGEGLLHDYIIPAFANAVDLTVDQVNTRLANGETLREIAVAQGFTGDKLTQLATQVVTDAINQAVDAGVITQSQADNLIQRMKNLWEFNFGPGFNFKYMPGWNFNREKPKY